MRQEEEFSALRIVRKGLLDSDKTMYRVYKSFEEFVSVEAASALEAFRASGINNPVKIERDIRFKDRLMKKDRLIEVDEVIETVLMETPSAIMGHQEPVPQQKPAAPGAFQKTGVTAKPAAVEAQPEAEVVEAEVVDSALSEADIQALLNDQKP